MNSTQLTEIKHCTVKRFYSYCSERRMNLSQVLCLSTLLPVCILVIGIKIVYSQGVLSAYQSHNEATIRFNLSRPGVLSCIPDYS